MNPMTKAELLSFLRRRRVEAPVGAAAAQSSSGLKLTRRASVLFRKIALEAACRAAASIHTSVLIRSSGAKGDSSRQIRAALGFAVYGDKFFLLIDRALFDAALFGSDEPAEADEAALLEKICIELAASYGDRGVCFIGVHPVYSAAARERVIPLELMLAGKPAYAEVVLTPAVIRRLDAYSKLLIDRRSKALLKETSVRTILSATSLPAQISALIGSRESSKPPILLSKSDVGWEVQARVRSFSAALIKLKAAPGSESRSIRLKAD